jgi:hypothetical protein
MELDWTPTGVKERGGIYRMGSTMKAVIKAMNRLARVEETSTL